MVPVVGTSASVPTVFVTVRFIYKRTPVTVVDEFGNGTTSSYPSDVRTELTRRGEIAADRAYALAVTCVLLFRDCARPPRSCGFSGRPEEILPAVAVPETYRGSRSWRA